MRWLMYRGLAAAAGCASAGNGLETFDELVGRYEFENAIAGEGEVAVRGTVDVGRYTFVLSTNQGRCSGRVPPARGRGMTLSCSSMRLEIRRTADGPDEHATLYLPLPETVHREQCVEYREDTQGRRYCIRTEVQPETRMVNRGMRVTLRRIEGGGATSA